MEKIQNVSLSKLAYYDIHKYTKLKKKPENIYQEPNDSDKKINCFYILFSACFLVQTILIAKKLDGVLSNTSWYLVFLPLILAALFSGILLLSGELECFLISMSIIVIGSLFSIIFSVASKLENKITAKYVFFFIFISIFFFFYINFFFFKKSVILIPVWLFNSIVIIIGFILGLDMSYGGEMFYLICFYISYISFFLFQIFSIIIADGSSINKISVFISIYLSIFFVLLPMVISFIYNVKIKKKSQYKVEEKFDETFEVL